MAVPRISRSPHLNTAFAFLQSATSLHRVAPDRAQARNATQRNAAHRTAQLGAFLGSIIPEHELSTWTRDIVDEMYHLVLLAVCEPKIPLDQVQAHIYFLIKPSANDSTGDIDNGSGERHEEQGAERGGSGANNSGERLITQEEGSSHKRQKIAPSQDQDCHEEAINPSGDTASGHFNQDRHRHRPYHLMSPTKILSQTKRRKLQDVKQRKYTFLIWLDDPPWLRKPLTPFQAFLRCVKRQHSVDALSERRRQMQQEVEAAQEELEKIELDKQDNLAIQKRIRDILKRRGSNDTGKWPDALD
ncbi:hypothetical protein F53441_1080 [Fusarium austroafricanum]|uniref:Uncharacterized protein n=1 Tax=Fusarium austroafricanum TaxID=2364996 RepID=A0A8H4NZF0_9HYPO|nr:hypothetical protein F53441_1080 [Fusarium austroafricanum]